MCISATTAALISAGATTGASIYNAVEQRNQAKEQQRILAAGEEEAQQIAKEGEDITNKFAKDVFDPSKRDERYEAQIGQREQSLADALVSANEGNSNAAVANVGGDYTRANADAQQANAADGLKNARMMARLGGSGLMFGQEAMMGGQLASDLAGISSKQRRNSRITQGAAGRVRGGSFAPALINGIGAGAMAFGGSSK